MSRAVAGDVPRTNGAVPGVEPRGARSRILTSAFWLGLLVVVVMAGQAVSARTASAEIQVVTNSATNRFPDGVQFALFFSSDAPPTDIRLRFRILPDGVSATVRPDCTEGRVMNCTAVVGNVGETYMVPGAEIRYSWQVTDETGARFQTDEASIVYEDVRFDWQSITEGNLTVNYYFGDEESQRSVLNVATETVNRFSELLKTTIDFPVKIWVYQTAQEMQPAIASRRGQGNDRTIQTLGEVGASDTALVSRDTEFLDIVRHELTHVVTGAATRGHLVDIPVWVNEGLSTYSQNQLLPNEANALQSAIQRNQVLPLTSLGVSARGTGGQVSLFYAQSGSIVSFMIEELGGDKFGDFIAAMKNDTPEGAMQSVYGLDQIGLENAWRESVGLPPFDPSAPTPNPNQQEETPTAGPNQTGANPTATPRSQAQGNQNDDDDNNPPAANASDDSGGISTVVIILVVLVAAVVALVGAAAALMMKGRNTAD